jgi:hypothetical protein
MQHKAVYLYSASSPYTPRRYPYFDVVVGLEWSNEPESYAGGSVMLPAGSPMPDRSRAMTQIKRDMLVLHVGGWAQG